MESSGFDPTNSIKIGSYVLISTLLGKKVTRLVKVEPTGFVYLKKDKVDLRTAVGDPFDSIYSLDRSNHSLKKISFTQEQLRDIFNSVQTFAELNPEEDNKDNRHLNDDGLSQKLDRDEIEALKKQGVSGDEIVQTIAKNCVTFKDKNTFSQEKYLKKKQAKYSNLFRIEKPSPALLVEMYYSSGPMKICNLRIDTLAQMLTLCNVHSSGNYIVVDTNLGLLTAAVVDRLIGDGSLINLGHKMGCCIQVYLDDGPITSWRQSVEALNLPSEVLDTCLCSLSLRRLNSMESMETMETNEKLDESEVLMSETNELELQPRDPKKRKFDEKAKRKAIRRKEEERALKILAKKEVDGILIVTTAYDPWSILNLLYPHLSPSKPYVVFSLTADCLLKCYEGLKGESINARIFETWLRYYQVLPSRTRPDNNMSGSGGYLLTGTKVLKS